MNQSPADRFRRLAKEAPDRPESPSLGPPAPPDTNLPSGEHFPSPRQDRSIPALSDPASFTPSNSEGRSPISPSPQVRPASGRDWPDAGRNPETSRGELGGSPLAPGSNPSAALPRRQRGKKSRPSYWGCLLRLGIAAWFLLTATLLAAATAGIYEYYRIAATLPSVDDLRARASQFETTRIFDRDGNLLYEILDPTEGRRTYVPLSNISPLLIATTLATEDKDFFTNPGFDPWAIVRAYLQNYQAGETVSGASTITQQLARALLFGPEERTQITYARKVREALLAIEITRRYSKEEILELYLNEIYYGNLSYGVEAAAETYFHTSADKLTLAQASFLAGLPQAPSVYDVFSNRDATLERQQQVLALTVQDVQEKGCIAVGGQKAPVCITADQAKEAAAQTASYTFLPPSEPMRDPHWVNYIRQLLEERYDPQTIYRSGFQVYTTLDPNLQDLAQSIVRNQVKGLADRHITGGALVAIRPATGEILAMVGSPDYYAQPAGQVNMAIEPRQPGSSIKPITYVLAFEKGWTPATLIWDVPSEFPPSGNPGDTHPPYKPVNYDGIFHGPVTVRTALANSYNIPAVKALQFVGVYDDPSLPPGNGLVGMAKRLGITTLTGTDYGLALTLGGGAVTPLQLTGAYAVFANGGRRVPPVAITRITTYDGRPVFQYHPPTGEQVIPSDLAFLIDSILSDNVARTPEFGAHSVLNLPFQVAAKTGTTNDFRDNWTLGYTPDLAVGVWVGNPDDSPMQGTTGVTGAAPIWSQFMQAAVPSLTGGKPTPFVPPAGVVQEKICTLTGAQPSHYCKSTRMEYFAANQPPLPSDQDLWREVWVDTFTQLRASAACSQFVAKELTIAVDDPWARKWLSETRDGQKWAKANRFPSPILFYPDQECTAASPHPSLAITSPTEGQTLMASTVSISGEADATADFDHYLLEYGLGPDPSNWASLSGPSTSPLPSAQKIVDWNVSGIPAGILTLRLTVFSKGGGKAEARVHFILVQPTPTPTPTPIPTPTPTFTATPVPTNTPTATDTPQPSDTLTPSPSTTTASPPSETPTLAPSA